MPLSPADNKAAALWALTYIEHQRASGKIGPQAFPAYHRGHTSLAAGRCEMIIETRDDNTTLTVFPPAAIGLSQPINVDLSNVISFPGITPPTLLGDLKAVSPVARFNIAEKLERDGKAVPVQHWASIDAYVEGGYATSSVLTAILEGRLFDAVRIADAETRDALVGIVNFFRNHLPLASYGTPEVVAEWRQRQAQHRAAFERSHGSVR